MSASVSEPELADAYAKEFTEPSDVMWDSTVADGLGEDEPI
jgi:hypothetical protein